MKTFLSLARSSKPIPQCPEAGNGVHRWCLEAAWQCRFANIEPAQAVFTLQQMITRPQNPPNEIDTAVALAYASQTMSKPSKAPSPALKISRWPAMNSEQREAVISNEGNLATLWEASPIRFDDDRPHTEAVIDKLFPNDPLLCCGWSAHRFHTRPRSFWKGICAELSFIVPSPMSSVVGTTKAGQPSEHSLSNTGQRRFLVIEQDCGSVDDQAAVILHLARSAPLALAVHSGGKSVHAWFCCAGQDEHALRRFMESAVALGADPATWTRSQFVRMPDGLRAAGKRQSILFYNPEVLQ